MWILRGSWYIRAEYVWTFKKELAHWVFSWRLSFVFLLLWGPSVHRAVPSFPTPLSTSCVQSPDRTVVTASPELHLISLYVYYHFSSSASNILHGWRRLWKQNTRIWYHCLHFSYVLASITVLLIFMKSEKINILRLFPLNGNVMVSNPRENNWEVLQTHIFSLKVGKELQLGRRNNFPDTSGLPRVDG